MIEFLIGLLIGYIVGCYLGRRARARYRLVRRALPVMHLDQAWQLREWRESRSGYYPEGDTFVNWTWSRLMAKTWEEWRRGE